MIIQRRLLWTAVRLLKVGGTLVYSTCTITAQENEQCVAYVLKSFDCLRLVPCYDSSLRPPCETSTYPHIQDTGDVGLPDCGLSEEERLMVRRFDPAIPSVFYPACIFPQNTQRCSYSAHTTTTTDGLRYYRILLRQIRQGPRL